MKKENEICVKTIKSLKEIDQILKEQDFQIIDKFLLEDIYYTKFENSKKSNVEKLKEYILIREVDKQRKTIVLKKKIFDNLGNITDQSSLSCDVNNIKDACDIIESMGYDKFANLIDMNYLYSNEINEIYVQVINDKVYLEIEEKNSNVSSIKELENILLNYNIPYDNNDLFVKKVLDNLK